MRPKLIYVGFCFNEHRNTHAGYQQIKNKVNYDAYVDGQKDFNFTINLIGKLPKPIELIYRRFIGYRLWYTELKCILRAIFFKNQVFHFIYGENIIKNIGKFKGKTNKVVCTYHQPISVFKEHPSWIEGLSKIDKIILLSEVEHQFFKEHNHNVQIKYIPHGIDINYYKPNGLKKEKMILMVGNWLRDYAFANEVFEELLKKRPDVKIKVIVNKEFFRFFAHSNIEKETKISDETLLNYYNMAAVVFFPLIEFTANNSLLEAAACGCDILITTSQKKISYFNTTHVKIQDPDITSAVNYLLNRIDNPVHNEELRKYTIDNYSWNSIGKETEFFLLQN